MPIGNQFVRTISLPSVSASAINKSWHIIYNAEPSNRTKSMKSKHRISKIDKDILILDDKSVYRADIMSSSKLMFWSMTMDQVEVESTGLGVKITNLKRNETIKASKVS